MSDWQSELEDAMEALTQPRLRLDPEQDAIRDREIEEQKARIRRIVRTAKTAKAVSENNDPVFNTNSCAHACEMLDELAGPKWRGKEG